MGKMDHARKRNTLLDNGQNYNMMVVAENI